MTLIEILRSYRQVSVKDLVENAQITKQTYYNAVAGYNLTDATMEKIDAALKLDGYLAVATCIDRLALLGVQVPADVLPDHHRRIHDFVVKHREKYASLNLIDVVPFVKIPVAR